VIKLEVSFAFYTTNLYAQINLATSKS